MPESSPPQTLRLTPPLLRTALLFAASLIWLGFGAYLFSQTRSVLPLALATLGLVGVVIYGLTLLPGSSYLEATPQGLTVSVAFRKRTHAWADIGEFSLRSLGRKKKLVRYRLRTPSAAAGKSPSRDQVLPDTYGLLAEELAARLNEMRRAALVDTPRTE